MLYEMDDDHLFHHHDSRFGIMTGNQHAALW